MTSLALILALATATQDPVAPKSPPPSKANLKLLSKQIRGLYTDLFASRSIDVLRTLTQTLRSEATKALEANQTFAFLTEARDLSVKLGDVTPALETVDAIGERFEINVPVMKAETLEALKKRVRTPEAALLLARAYVDLIEKAAASKDYDTALNVVKKAQSMVRAVRDAGLAARMRSLEKEVRERGREYKKVVAARQKLNEDPSDPEANLTVGIYRCFTEDDWEGGLPFLAKGSDAAVVDLANREKESPATSRDREALGDGWWEAARKRKGPLQDGFRDRAFHWYESARAGLAGLQKLRLEKKLDKLEAETPGRLRIHPVLGYRLKRHPADAIPFNRHWYLAIPGSITDPEEARKRCRELGGYLACIETEDEQSFLKKIAGEYKTWLGGSSGDTNKWIWMNGSPMTFKGWDAGQPDNGANCNQQFWPASSGWHDIPVGSTEYPAGFVCEWEF